MTNNPITITQEFNAPVNKVWAAITSKNEMVKWFFENMPDFKPAVGFETSFNVSTPENKNYLHMWKVTEVIPLQKIAYSWKFKGYAGKSLVVWELTPNNNKTALRFAHHGWDNFPQDNPDFSRESCCNGWSYFINQQLKNFLENKNE